MPNANSNTDQTFLGSKVAAQVHDLYTLFRPIWMQLAHVREGTGGFIDGTYLVAHPREYLDHTSTQTVQDTVTGALTTVTTVNPRPRKPSPKLQARRKLARYENIASAILDTKKTALFRELPNRRVGAAPAKPKPNAPKKTPAPPSKLEQWWTNVDGCGTDIDNAMRGWWDLAGTFGHLVLYLDVAPAPVTDGAVQTAADQAVPYVRPYTPLDVLDWRRDDEGNLIWIKLLEATTTKPDLDTPTVTTYRIRIVDQETWKLYDYKKGGFISSGDHGLGVVPVVYLYAKRRALLTDLGESVLGDPRNYIDLFNLESEKRELLRNQTFSFINLPLGTGADAMSVTDAQAMMGQQTGTMNVLFSAQPAVILTGDANNVASYEAAIASLKREIYRETGMQWETDTKDAESKGSLELKREDMHVRLSGYADECQQTEIALAKLWYRAEYGAEAGPTTFDSDQVTIHYPDRFSATPFDEVLQQVEAAQAIGMPAIFLKELRKAILTKFEGMSNLTPEQLSAITDAIDAAPDDPTPAERLRQKMDLMTAAAGAKTFGLTPPNENNLIADANAA